VTERTLQEESAVVVVLGELELVDEAGWEVVGLVDGGRDVVGPDEVDVLSGTAAVVEGPSAKVDDDVATSTGRALTCESVKLTICHVSSVVTTRTATQAAPILHGVMLVIVPEGLV
jgi:hypothetical protein